MKRIALLLPFVLLFPPPAFAGKIFGNLKEGGRSVGQGVEVRIKCKDSAALDPIKTDEYGAYSINVPRGRCELRVKYSADQWTEPVAIVSSDDPARYDFELVKENGQYVLRRR